MAKRSKPLFKSNKHPEPSKNGNSHRRQSEAGEEVLDSAGDMLDRAAGEGARRGSTFGRLARGVGAAWGVAKTGAWIAAGVYIYNNFKQFLGEFPGFKYDLRKNDGPSRPTPPVDNSKLDTAAGRAAQATSNSVTEALSGSGPVERALEGKANRGLSAEQIQKLPADPTSSLDASLKGQVIRVSLPGSQGKTFDYKLPGGVPNDQAALKAFQEHYAASAQVHGGSPELPAGAVLTIGSEGGWLSGDPTPAREYRFVRDNLFERNAEMAGTLAKPGERAWSQDPEFRSGKGSFDPLQVSASSPNLVQALGLREQAASSALITQKTNYDPSVASPVSTPAGLGALLGRGEGSDFSSIATEIGARTGGAEIVRTVDLAEGGRSVGLLSGEGGVAITSGSDRDRLAASRDYGDVRVFASLEAAAGSLGKFDDTGRFAGNELASTSLSSVRKALEEAKESPAVEMMRKAGANGIAVYKDLTPGAESAVLRGGNENGMFDVRFTDKLMLLSRVNPDTGKVEDVGAVRSAGISVKNGQVTLDDRSKAALADYSKVVLEGRSLEAFYKVHPAANDVASVKDAIRGAEEGVIGTKAAYSKNGVDHNAMTEILAGPAPGGPQLTAEILEEAGRGFQGAQQAFGASQPRRERELGLG